MERPRLKSWAPRFTLPRRLTYSHSSESPFFFLLLSTQHEPPNPSRRDGPAADLACTTAIACIRPSAPNKQTRRVITHDQTYTHHTTHSRREHECRTRTETRAKNPVAHVLTRPSTNKSTTTDGRDGTSASPGRYLCFPPPPPSVCLSVCQREPADTSWIRNVIYTVCLSACLPACLTD